MAHFLFCFLSQTGPHTVTLPGIERRTTVYVPQLPASPLVRRVPYRQIRCRPLLGLGRLLKKGEGTARILP